MPDGKVEYVVELLRRGDGAALAAVDLNKVEAAATKSNAAVGGVTSGFKSLFAVLGGTAILRTAINAFIESEEALSRLRSVLRSTKQYSEEYFESLKELAEGLRQATKFSDEEITGVMSKLISLGARRQDVARLTEAVLDLATVFDRDLGRATLAMGRALMGDVGAFSQFGIEVNKTLPPTQQFAQILEQIGTKSAGAAREAMKSLGGEIISVRKELNEFMETLGKGLAMGLHQVFRAGEFLHAGLEVKDIVAAKEGYLGVVEQQRQVILQLERLKKINKETAGEWLAELSAVEAKLRYLFSSGAGQDADAQRARATVFPEVGSALSRSGARLGVAAGAGPGAGARAGAVPPGSAALQAADTAQAHAEMIAFWEEAQKTYEEVQALALKTAKEKEDQEQRYAREQIDNMQRVAGMERDLKNQARLSGLEGIAREREQLAISHEERVLQIQQLKFENADLYLDMMAMEGNLYAAERKRLEYSHSGAARMKADFIQLGTTAKEAFAGGLADALVNAFEEGDDAFKRFAANFLKQIASMILQALILRAINAGMSFIGMGSGGMVMAAAGVAGVREVTGPTYFPQFNVLAGEAGREVMTVLAHPRLMNVGGIPAQVGDVGPNRLAIVSAAALGRMAPRRWAGGGSTGGVPGGGGGEIEITVNLSRDLEARVTKQAVEGARVRVTQDMSSDTTLSRATRRLQA